MSHIEVLLPKLGESIVSATVVQWLKKEGDQVLEDEPLVEVATDKVNSEIPSPCAGRLKRIVVGVDERLDVGALLALIDPAVQPEQKVPAPTLSPAVVRLAQEAGVAISELQGLKGSGEGGRLTKRDVEDYLASRSSSPSQVSELAPMRRFIAENVARSFREVPHGYFATEIDVTELLEHIQAQKESFLAKTGHKLTLTAPIIASMARALAGFESINSSFVDGRIVMKRDVNVGVAVNVPDGLVVPVIKNVPALSLEEVAVALSTLSQKARTKSLLPDDVAGGTMTLTNFGMSGIQIGLPIIRQPEAAIIAIGTVDKRVKVDDEDRFVVRKTLFASLSFDHRIIDGMYASGYLAKFKDLIENFQF